MHHKTHHISTQELHAIYHLYGEFGLVIARNMGDSCTTPYSLVRTAPTSPPSHAFAAAYLVYAIVLRISLR